MTKINVRLFREPTKDRFVLNIDKEFLDLFFLSPVPMVSVSNVDSDGGDGAINSNIRSHLEKLLAQHA